MSNRALLAVALEGSFGSISLSKPNNCSNLAYTDVLLYTWISKVSRYKLSLVLECDKSGKEKSINVQALRLYGAISEEYAT